MTKQPFLGTGSLLTKTVSLQGNDSKVKPSLLWLLWSYSWGGKQKRILQPDTNALLLVLYLKRKQFQVSNPGRFVSTTSMAHRTNTCEKKGQWEKGMLFLNQQGLLQTAHQELHNPCSGERKWVKILEEILLLSLKNKINFRLTVLSSVVPRNVDPTKNQFLKESVSNAGTSRTLRCLSWHPGRSSWLHSTTWQCLCMNIKASVGQWLIADLFLLKLILTPPVSHFHPPLNEHFFTTTALDTNCPTDNPRDYRENTCGILECVCKDSTAAVESAANSQGFHIPLHQGSGHNLFLTCQKKK